jgi:hypothetical protein
MRKKVGVFMVLLMTVLAALPGLASAATLTKPEIDALLLMREEEKMARDVYLQLNDLWGLPIFQNIESSEQTHMDAVKTLLDRYGLQDPAAGRGEGEFSIPYPSGWERLHTATGAGQRARQRCDAVRVPRRVGTFQDGCARIIGMPYENVCTCRDGFMGRPAA